MSSASLAQGAALPREVNPWIVAVAVMSATFMEVLDTTVVNVSLPHIAGNLSATIDESTWALTSYLVANAIILPLTGWIANYFGRKRLLLSSVAGFTVASFLCGLAPNLPLLILFRVIQGFTGGALQPISQAVLLEAFKPEERGRAMGFWGLGIVVAPILGPVLGGWLTDSYSWRWVFYINIPVGIVSLLLIQLYVFDPAYITRRSNRVDYWGIGMLAVGVGALQLMLDKGQEDDWFESNFIVALVVIAVLMLLAFIVRELKTEHPVVDLRVLKVPTYATGVFLMTVVGFVLYGSLVLLPLMLQTLLGYPSLQAGIALAPRGMGSFIAMPLVGMIMGKVDARKLLAMGLAVGALTLFWLGSLNRNLGYWDIFWPQFIQGMGARAAVRAAHHDHDGPDPAREHGQRHQHLQPDAQHRRQHGDRHRDDAPDAPPPGAHEQPRLARGRLLAPGARDVRAAEGGVRRAGGRRRHRRRPRAARALRHGAARGDDAVVHRHLPLAVAAVPGDAAAAADHAQPAPRPPDGRRALSL